MGRIRTIKPEFPQSETMGKISRDARLLFIELWTIADDHGRARANPRMLASLLFPYDNDAGELIDDWLDELEDAECIRRYVVDGSTYLEISNWSKHQKVEKPSASKYPSFDDGSPIIRRNLPDPSVKIAQDQGPRTKDQGREGIKEVEGEGSEIRPPSQDDRPILDQAVRRFNAVADDLKLPKVQRLTEPRKAALRKRLRECGGIEGWDFAMTKIRGSPFLRGENRQRWKADFDFVLQQKSFTKLMEGGYDDRGPTNPVQAAFDDLGERFREGSGDPGHDGRDQFEDFPASR